jgi:hypothetical protein
MRSKVKAVSPQLALSRILEALEQELIDVPGEEIIGMALELGMDPRMEASAAYIGLKVPAKPKRSDFFAWDAAPRLQRSVASPPQPKDSGDD